MPSYASRFNPFEQDDQGNQRQVPPAAVLAKRGPVLVPVVLTLAEAHRREAANKGRAIQPVTGVALVDTGASVTCFDQEAATKAGLPVVGTGSMSSASHDNLAVPLYAGTLQIPGLGDLTLKKAMGATLASQNLLALLGRDALNGMLFVYNGIDGSFVLSR